ncbi:hypothetical protein [Methyloterricola oryzae]|uniref:hypothetical protein n=1 Tax=Methyloterricola oryzae TaxID=1495050 RepID=UPI0005EBB463|nr:hypothetical protein [Methyloterricola oryzae]
MQDANSIFKSSVRFLLAKPSNFVASVWPSPSSLSTMRRLNQIQLTASQLGAIVEVLRNKGPCKLLVFGLGNDSKFWHAVNKGGETVFLENHPGWLEKVVGAAPYIQAYLVNYDTRLRDWRELMAVPDRLALELPEAVLKQQWDVVLVDGPRGWNDQMPGRMKSIFEASRLVAPDGDIFVHDCEREVEDAYCNHFLGPENLELELPAEIGTLRHYRPS